MNREHDTLAGPRSDFHFVLLVCPRRAPRQKAVLLVCNRPKTSEVLLLQGLIVSARGMASSVTTPAPLCGTDDDAFTRDSIHTRLPALLEETARLNDGAWPAGASAALRDLAQEFRDDCRVACLAQPQVEPAWAVDVMPYVGERYSAVPWFFLETYAYKRVLDVCTAWCAEPRFDPFQRQKDAALQAARGAFVASALPLCGLPETGGPSDSTAALRSALLRSLWGNRADLSLSAGVVEASGGEGHSQGGADAILADDSDGVMKVLTGGGTLALLLDNCGLELLCDLVLTDTLLRHGAVSRVVLHVKTSPVFVSDAMEKDVHAHIAWLRDDLGGGGGAGQEDAAAPLAARALARRLSAWLADGTLSIHPDPFYTSYLPFWDAPDTLTSLLRPCTLAIVKGDASYRRIVGDRHWPHSTPFAHVVSYFPCPVLALRTCKAGVLVGVSPEAEARAARADPSNWLVSGKYGLVQLKV